MKKIYEKPVMTPVGFEPNSGFLTGSKTTVKIDVGDIAVEDFKSGFGTETDIAAGRDFKDISFD